MPVTALACFRAFLVISFIAGFSALFAWLSSNNVHRTFGIVGLTAVTSFGIQWLAWVPAAWFVTEHFYDLTGGVT